MQPPLHGTLVMMDAVAITLSPYLCMRQTGRMQEDGARGERRSLGNDRHKFFGKCRAAKKMTLHGVKGQKRDLPGRERVAVDFSVRNAD